MADKSVTPEVPPEDSAPPAAPTVSIPPKRSPGHRGADVKDTVAEMTAKAHEISLEAGSKMAAAMKDVVNAAAGLTGFVLESARDLVQYMVRRGQMTQEEADKLIRQAEDAQVGRPAPPPRAPEPEPAPKAASAPAAAPTVPSAHESTPPPPAAAHKPEHKAEHKVEQKPIAKPAAAPKAAAKTPGSKPAAPSAKTAAKAPAKKPAARTAHKSDHPVAKKAAKPAPKKATTKRK